MGLVILRILDERLSNQVKGKENLVGSGIGIRNGLGLGLVFTNQGSLIRITWLDVIWCL